MNYDWDLIDKLGRKARYQSESEKADAVYLSKARNYALYANPGDVSPIVGWTLSEAWTDAEQFNAADFPRGVLYGPFGAGQCNACSGEINPSR